MSLTISEKNLLYCGGIAETERRKRQIARYQIHPIWTPKVPIKKRVRKRKSPELTIITED